MKEKSKKTTLLLIALLTLVAISAGIVCYVRYHVASGDEPLKANLADSVGSSGAKPATMGEDDNVGDVSNYRTAKTTEQEKEPIPITPSCELICTKENPNHQGILNYIKEINPSFDIKTCIIKDPDWDNQLQPMVINETVDGFKTKSGYTVSRSNGKVNMIYDGIVKFDKNVKAPKFSEASVVKKAKKKAIGWNRDKVAKQEVVKWYDIDKKQFSIHVGTIFIDSAGDKYGTDYAYVLK